MRDISLRVPFSHRASAAPKVSQPALFYGLFALLVATNVATGVGFLMSADIARLMGGRNDQVLAAYEDRIAELRVEVDRLHSRHYAQTGDINLQLQELAQQQEMLTEQHQYVKVLAEKAEALGLETAAVAPQPMPAPMHTSDNSPATTIEDAGAQVEAMLEDTRMALAAINDAATESTDEIVAELRGLGIRPDLPEGVGEAIGGPLLPADDSPDSIDLVDDANAVMESLSRFKAAQDALDLAPIHRPLTNYTRISSGYGNRTDPFTRGRAFHAGLDFPAPKGTTVLSAGHGKVVFVGQRSGYGNVVEIDHGNGLLTRYGHLSAFLVDEGQVVDTGTPIAKVGSTGRSTGPHLHFEVRRDDRTIDPQKFLGAGRRLAKFIAAA